MAFGLGNHSLGHGDVGNLETLLMASEVLRDGPKRFALVDERAKLILKDILVNGWRSAHPSYAEVPGQMTGIAGIGFGMLRMANPAQTPSVLLLEALKSTHV